MAAADRSSRGQCARRTEDSTRSPYSSHFSVQRKSIPMPYEIGIVSWEWDECCCCSLLLVWPYPNDFSHWSPFHWLTRSEPCTETGWQILVLCTNWWVVIFTVLYISYRAAEATYTEDWVPTRTERTSPWKWTLSAFLSTDLIFDFWIKSN